MSLILMSYSDRGDVWCIPEFWKHIPPNEPFRVLLGDMRDKLYNSRERMRQLLATGKSDFAVEDTYTDASQVLSLRTKPALSYLFLFIKY